MRNSIAALVLLHYYSCTTTNSFVIPLAPTATHQYHRDRVRVRQYHASNQNNNDQGSSSNTLQDRLRQLAESEQRQELLLHRNWDKGHWNQHVIPLDKQQEEDIAVGTICCVESTPSSMIFLGDSLGQIHVVRPPVSFIAEQEQQQMVQETFNITTNNNDNLPTMIVAMAYIPDYCEDALICASPQGLYYWQYQPQQQQSQHDNDPQHRRPQPLLLLQDDFSNLLDLYVTTTTADSSSSSSDENADDLYRVIAVFSNRVQIYQLQLSDGAAVLQPDTVTTISIMTNDDDDNNDKSSNDFQRGNMITSSALDGGRLYLGMSTGYVWQYTIKGQQQQQQIPKNISRWKINSLDVAITALALAPSSVVINRRNAAAAAQQQQQLPPTKMDLLWTGDASGTVRQWGILDRVRLWPQMATQKLPNHRAHQFVAHDDAIYRIVPIDALHFVSCSKDGTIRAWNAKTAAQLFLLTGFDDVVTTNAAAGNDHGTAAAPTTTTNNGIVHTTVWNDSALITAHAKSITIHQFNIDTPTDFDLDMPEYRS